MKKRFSEEQIIGLLKQVSASVPVKDLCWQHGFNDGPFYNWCAESVGMSVPDVKRLKESAAENVRLKRMQADSTVGAEAQKAALGLDRRSASMHRSQLTVDPALR
ncbi:MAG: transposase [Zoogloeaceae bacterium]|nr:transposase [Rhodocyclaceae bacterium]MCP5237699.1 transposase [Zoogloeaceae bacterium]